MWKADTGEDTKCPAMEPMCQIMFYNQLPTTDTIHKWTLAPEVGLFHRCHDRCGIRTLGRTPSVQSWNRCVKSCFIINCQLLTPFTSGPWLQKWAGLTSVPSPMCNPDTGADTKCSAMERMCKIRFYIQLPPSYIIHKWTLAPEVGWFHTDVEPRHWGRHQVSGHGRDVSNQVLYSNATF